MPETVLVETVDFRAAAAAFSHQNAPTNPKACGGGGGRGGGACGAGGSGARGGGGVGTGIGTDRGGRPCAGADKGARDLLHGSVTTARAASAAPPAAKPSPANVPNWPPQPSGVAASQAAAPSAPPAPSFKSAPKPSPAAADNLYRAQSFVPTSSPKSFVGGGGGSGGGGGGGGGASSDAADGDPLAAYASKCVLLYTSMTRDQLATVAQRQKIRRLEQRTILSLHAVQHSSH
jgi:hypothetical protein